MSTESQPRRRHWAVVAIVVPYVALGVGTAALLGAYQNKRDQDVLEARLAAEAAEERAAEAQQQTLIQCLVSKKAREDTNEMFLLAAAGLPPRFGDQIAQIVATRPPVNC